MWLHTFNPGPPGSPGYFSYPDQVAVGPDSTIYILYSRGSVVLVYGTDWKFLRQIHISNARCASGVSVSADGHFIYVADESTYRVCVFTSDGKFSRHIGKRGDGTTDLTTPYAVVAGSDGNIYVADHDNHRVQVYTHAGQHVRQIGSPDAEATDHLANPRSIAVTSEGLVYVARRLHYPRVHVFNSTGTTAEWRRGNSTTFILVQLVQLREILAPVGYNSANFLVQPILPREFVNREAALRRHLGAALTGTFLHEITGLDAV